MASRRRRGWGHLDGARRGARPRWVVRLARGLRAAPARFDAGVRLVGLLSVLVAALALFGITLRAVAVHRLDATEGLLTQHGRALATAQDLRAALSRADAAAAAEVFAPVELLVDRGDSAADLRKRYDGIKRDALFETSVATAARDVVELRRLDTTLCLPGPTGPGDASGAGPFSLAGGAGDQGPRGPVDGPAVDGPVAGGPEVDGPAVDGAAVDAPVVEGAAVDGPMVEGSDPLAPGPAATSCPFDQVAEGIPVYNGMVERARANNRAGLSVGEANLRAASTMMRAQILPSTEVLVARYAEAIDGAYQSATGSRGEWAIVVTAALALAALVGVQLLLVRRTNRLVNPCLLLAAGCVLTTVTWTAVAFGTQQTRLDTARDAGYRPMTLLARSKTLALEARVDENLSLTALGNGTRFDQHFAWVTRGLGFDPTGDRLPPEPVTRRGSLVVALDSREGAGMPAGLEDDLRTWLRIRASVVGLLASSPDSVVAAARAPGDAGSAADDPRSSDAFGRAVTRTLGPGTAAFNSFLGHLDVAIDTSRGRFERDVRQAADALRDLALAGPALVLAAIVLASAGLWPRIREYL